MIMQTRGANKATEKMRIAAVKAVERLNAFQLGISLRLIEVKESKGSLYIKFLDHDGTLYGAEIEAGVPIITFDAERHGYKGRIFLVTLAPKTTYVFHEKDIFMKWATNAEIRKAEKIGIGNVINICGLH